MIEAILIIALASLNLIHIKKESDFESKVKACIVKHIESYEDLCAESSDGHEDMKPIEAHRAGSMCVANAIDSCINR